MKVEIEKLAIAGSCDKCSKDRWYYYGKFRKCVNCQIVVLRKATRRKVT